MMLRPLVFTVLLFVMVSFGGQNISVASAAELKIGVMNVQKVLLDSVSGKSAKNLFETKAKELKGKFQNDENALTAMQQEIEKKSSAWSAEKKEAQVRVVQARNQIKNGAFACPAWANDGDHAPWADAEGDIFNLIQLVNIIKSARCIAIVSHCKCLMVGNCNSYSESASFLFW